MFLSSFDHRHISEYLAVQPKDPKAHKFLGQLFERDGETDKAVGCYKVRLKFPFCIVFKNTLQRWSLTRIIWKIIVHWDTILGHTSRHSLNMRWTLVVLIIAFNALSKFSMNVW